MGLKCSLFGHAFDERDVVRERESKGSEVVTVAKDVERCTECGATRVVSTNKEVVSTAGATADGGVDSSPTLRTPGDGTGDGTGGAETRDGFDAADQLDAGADSGGPATEAGTGTERPAAATAGDDDAVDASAGADDTGFASATDETTTDALASDAGEDGGVELLTDESDAAASPSDADLDSDPDSDPAPETATDDTPDRETEDAEILTDEPEPDRAPGQWPGDDAGDAWEPQPLTDDGDAGTDDETGASGADETGAGTDADADEADAELLDEADDRDAGGAPDTEAEPAPNLEPEPAATASFTVPDGHYRCPECGHTIPAESSFRRGDACPECIEGYLEAGE